MAVTAPAHDTHAAGPRDDRPIWRRPNLLRGLLFFLVGAALSYVLVGVLRTVNHYPDKWDDWDAIIQVGLIAAPLFFLVGLGAFDYWFRWAAGKPTQPEDHSSHGAYSWRDYFRVNTDHKVIGIQYIVTTFFFFIIGGMLAMIMRAELAAPGEQFVDPNTFNGLFSVHASLMIFLFIIPVFADIANYVIPLMIGARDVAFPRLNAWSYWMYLFGGLALYASVLFSPPEAGWFSYVPLSLKQYSGTNGQEAWIYMVHLTGLSSIIGARRGTYSR